MKKTLHHSIRVVGLVASLLLALVFLIVTNAAPMPPRLVVNPQTRQCALLTPGDECGDVILPPGWEYLEAENAQCPAGYTSIDLNPEWAHFKTTFCCSEGHSGSPGDCQDVVIHSLKRQCAFVADIQQCAGLPFGWKAWGKNCPSEFKWVDDVACTNEQPVQTAIAATPRPTEPSSSTARNPLLPCLSPGLVLAALLMTKFLFSLRIVE